MFFGINLDLKSLHSMEPFVCLNSNISFSFRIFRFSRLGVVSLPCEWSWAIRLSAAPVAPYWEPTTALMLMKFWRKIFEDGHCPSPGLLAVPYLALPELSLISNVKPKENILRLSPVTGTG
jgi:hypothetical protein